MATSVNYQGKVDVEEAVKRPLWEPRHEWEARVKFVEDYVHDHGLEKAVNLSLVWANMKFLGCHYPKGTEALVADYPMPSIEELKARRKCKNSVQKYRRSSQSNKAAGSFAEVTALLDSIHTQTSIKATHPQLQVIGNEVCLCKDCLGWSQSEAYYSKGLKVLEYLKKSRKDIACELTCEGNTWSLVINTEVVLKRNDSKELVLEDFIKILSNWQEANQKPACPLVANQPQMDSSSGYQSDPYYSGQSRYSGGGYSGGYGGGPYQHTPNWRGYN